MQHVARNFMYYSAKQRQQQRQQLDFPSVKARRSNGMCGHSLPSLSWENNFEAWFTIFTTLYNRPRGGRNTRKSGRSSCVNTSLIYRRALPEFSIRDSAAFICIICVYIYSGHCWSPISREYRQAFLYRPWKLRIYIRWLSSTYFVILNKRYCWIVEKSVFDFR